MNSSIETIIAQIRPLIVSLSAEDRLALIQAIAGAGQIGEKDDILAREQAAWFALPENERRKFAGEYVAVSLGRVVDHDADQRSLYLRTRQRFGQKKVLIIFADYDEPPLFTIHSPLRER